MAHLKITCKHHIRAANMIGASMKSNERVGNGNRAPTKLTVGSTSEVEHF